MCGATDCHSCGPAQGYKVIRHPTRGWINPDWFTCCECGREFDLDQQILLADSEYCPECYDELVKDLPEPEGDEGVEQD